MQGEIQVQVCFVVSFSTLSFNSVVGLVHFVRNENNVVIHDLSHYVRVRHRRKSYEKLSIGNKKANVRRTNIETSGDLYKVSATHQLLKQTVSEWCD